MLIWINSIPVHIHCSDNKSVDMLLGIAFEPRLTFDIQKPSLMIHFQQHAGL